MLQEQGKYEQALEKYNQSLFIKIITNGKHHADVATSLNNIGRVLYDQGKYDQALEKYNQSLAIEIKTKGKHHPDVAIRSIYYGGRQIISFECLAKTNNNYTFKLSQVITNVLKKWRIIFH